MVNSVQQPIKAWDIYSITVHWGHLSIFWWQETALQLLHVPSQGFGVR